VARCNYRLSEPRSQISSLQAVRRSSELSSFLSASEGIIILSLDSVAGPQGLPSSETVRSAIQGKLGQVKSIEDRSSKQISIFRVEYSDDRDAERVVGQLQGQTLDPIGLKIRCNYVPHSLVSDGVLVS
jgi:hypothetical protein